MRMVSTLDKVIDFNQKRLIQVRELIEATTGVDDLTSPCRKESFTAARALMASYCKSLGMSRDQIAPIVGRREGSIFNMLASHKSWLKCWPRYKEWFNEIKSKIYEVQN